MLGDCPLAADIILTLSELAANAALHSKSCDPGGQFTVRAEIHPGDYAWVEVEDEGGTWTQPPADPIGGHGLDVVRALASDWGIDDCLGSRVVWARIEWPDHG